MSRRLILDVLGALKHEVATAMTAELPSALAARLGERIVKVGGHRGDEAKSMNMYHFLFTALRSYALGGKVRTRSACAPYLRGIDGNGDADNYATSARLQQQ